MSGDFKAIQDSLKRAADANKTALESINDVLGVMSNISGTIQLLQILQVWPQDNQLSQVLLQLQQLVGQISANDKLEKITAISDHVAPAVTVLWDLRRYLDATFPVGADVMQAALRDCIGAIAFFADPDPAGSVLGGPGAAPSWYAAFGDRSNYNDSWSGYLTPAVTGGPLDWSSATINQSGIVFDYLYTLPQFLRVITIFLLAITVCDPGVPMDDYLPVLNAALDTLTWVHDTISLGIVGTIEPTADEIGMYPDSYTDAYGNTKSTSEISSWNRGIRRVIDWPNKPVDVPPWCFGAVDAYTAVANLGSYKDFCPFLVDAAAWPGSMVSNFNGLLAVRIAQARKALYVQLGLPVVRRMIEKLRWLTTRSSTGAPPFEAWSVNELFANLGLTAPSDPSAVDPALKSFLSQTPPYGSFEIVENIGAPSPSVAIGTGLPLLASPIMHFLTGVHVPVGNTGAALSSHVTPDSLTQHVLYTSSDGLGHVHEFWRYTCAADQREDVDLMAPSIAASPASPKSIICSHSWPDSAAGSGIEREAFYVGNDGAVHGLRAKGTPAAWSTMPGLLAAQSGAPPALPSSLTSFVRPGQGQHVFYIGADGLFHLYHLEPALAGWKCVDYSYSVAKGVPYPTSNSVLSSCVAPDGSSQHLFYVDSNGDIQDVLGSLGSGANITSGTGAPKASPPSLSCYFWPDGSACHVFYVGQTDGDIHELIWNGSSWKYVKDLTLESNALRPVANSGLCAYMSTSQRQHVFYVDIDGDIRELAWPTWNPPGPFGIPGLPKYAWRDAGAPTSITGAVKPRTATAVTVFMRPDGRTDHVYYIGIDANLHELRRMGPVPEDSNWEWASNLTPV